jgi:hypothetical protein
VPQGFFDGVQNSDPPSTQRRRRSFVPSWELHLRALLARLPQPFHRSQPNADEPTELQQRPGPSTSPRRSPPIVEVPCIDDKKVRLFGVCSGWLVSQVLHTGTVCCLAAETSQPQR